MDSKFFKKSFSDFLTFSKGERNGTIILLFLVIVLAIVRLVFPLNDKKNYPLNKSEKYDKQIVTDEHKVQSEDNKFSIRDQSSKKYNSSHGTRELAIKVTSVEINQADSVGLEHLPGIGPVFSRRIIKYRNALGGFYCKDQLKEIYGLKPEQFLKFEKYIKIDTTRIQKIFINKSSFREINSHPYISYDQTKIIMKLRNHGTIIRGDILWKEKIFDSIEIKKVLPYLNFEK
jgi:competence protein ComEA